jgi:hypothetical protein
VKYRRKESAGGTCAVCKQDVIIDTELWTQTCGCGEWPIAAVFRFNKTAYKRMLEDYEPLKIIVHF